MFSLRLGSSHVSMLNCIYKILERKVKFNVWLSRPQSVKLRVGMRGLAERHRWPGAAARRSAMFGINLTGPEGSHMGP